MARSMLSLGTEVFLAFCTASTRVGLPDISAPPILAATSMFLMSFANDLARRPSMTAFLCLVVAHLECPLTVLLLDAIDPGHSSQRSRIGSAGGLPLVPDLVRRERAAPLRGRDLGAPRDASCSGCRGSRPGVLSRPARPARP